METMLGGRTVGGTRSQPRAFWQKQTICTQSRRAETSVLAPSAGLGHVGGARRASLASWGLGLKDLTIYLLGSQSLLGPFPG